jgi:hypothetical protein
LRSLAGLIVLAAPLSIVAQGPVQQTFLEPFRLQPPPGVNRAGVALLASAIIPGLGQFYLGEQRWVPYVAVEAWAWITWYKQKSNGASLEDQYRDLAWRVARRGCGCERRDSTFPYYESMADAQYHKSGEYDANSLVDGVQPELDAGTFNGQLWLHAKALYLPGGIDLPPNTREYQSALDYYRKRAIPSGYRWNWGDSELEQDAFNRLIDRSDDSFRIATRTFGLILANHMVSAIDALITARFQAMTRTSPVEFGSELAPVNGSVLLTTTVRIPIGN